MIKVIKVSGRYNNIEFNADQFAKFKWNEHAWPDEKYTLYLKDGSGYNVSQEQHDRILKELTGTDDEA